MEAQRRLQFDDEDDDPRSRPLALQERRRRMMPMQRFHASNLPRRRAAATRWPCARACRRRPGARTPRRCSSPAPSCTPTPPPRRARFANEEEAFVYSRFSNPTVTMMERRLAALEGTERLHRHRQRHGGDPAARHGPAEGRRPRGLLAERVRLDDQAVPGLRASSASRPASSRRPTSAQWRAAMRPNTRLLFAETPTNPLTEVCDIARAGRDRARAAARCWRWTTASARRRCSSR